MINAKEQIIKLIKSEESRRKKTETKIMTLKDEDDTDIYTENFAENFSEDDEISTAEEGFMIGYLAA